MKRKGSSIRREAISSATEHWTALNNRIDPKKKNKRTVKYYSCIFYSIFLRFRKIYKS